MTTGLTPGPSATPLTYAQVALSALLLLVNLGLSVRLRLGLERSLAVGALRMVVQLLLVGLVLEWLFTQESPGLVLAIALVMTSVAGVSAVQRTRRRFAGIYLNSLVSVLGSAAVVTGVAVVGILRIQPWYSPQYVIPLLGMVLGNTLNGISLGLDRFIEGLFSQRALIETQLALGATRWEAAHPQVRDAIRVGLIPTLNSMMVMGLVSLPGMMTGQILAGAAPIDAVRYQIVIVFMVVAASALGTFSVVLLAFRTLLTPDHRLHLEGVDTRRP